MNKEVSGYIQKIGQDWQAEICKQLRSTIIKEAPAAEELLQWGKPHYKLNAKYLCVFGTAKDWVNLTVFNASSIKAGANLFEPTDHPDRKSIKIRKGQKIDFKVLSKIIQQAAS